MASGWQNKASRLAKMDKAEVRERVLQALRKRGDWTLYRLGLLKPPRVGAGGARNGRFFFETDEASQRAELLSRLLPAEASAIVREANDICEHRFRLLGYEGLDYGAEIDWHLDAVHSKRAPLKPWFKIQFLNFAEVGDHKVTWELNRHQHLVTLAKAGWLTNDRRYQDELIAQWRHWQKANPYPLGINWASSLEVAFRTLSWIWVDHLLPRAGTEQFRAELQGGLDTHGRYIEKFLSTYFSPNTHLLGELVALFFLGTLYPEMRGAERWREVAWQCLAKEAARQVRPDGVYFEQSLHYHVYALDFFLHARVLAGLNEERIPEQFDATLNKMLDVVASLAQAGPAEGFGDDDGGRLFHPRRNWTEHATDPLAVGKILYAREDLKAPLTEEAVWLFGEQAFTNLSQTSAKNEESEVHPAAFVDGGIYALVGFEPVVHELVIDGGPQGVGRSGHGHADALSLRWTAAGERWLVDSGSGVYIGVDSSQRDTFRGTAAHNTLRVDGEDQALPGDPFAWTNIPTTTVERWIVGETVQFFAGTHNGYTRLKQPVIHRRSVLLLGDGMVLVRDEALGDGEHELELNWHFAPGIEVLLENEAMLAMRRAGKVKMQFCIAGESKWWYEATESQISPAYGRFEESVRVRNTVGAVLPTEVATLVILQNALAGKALAAETGAGTLAQKLTHTSFGGVQRYRLASEGWTDSFFFSTGQKAWHAGSWSSDAEVLYCRTTGQKLERLVLIRASRVSFGDETILEEKQPMEWFEWSKAKDGVRSASSVKPAPNFKNEGSFAEGGISKPAPAAFAEKD